MISLLLPTEIRQILALFFERARDFKVFAHFGVNLHFLEKVPVGDDFQLLEDEEDPAADEEGLVFD